MTNSLASHDLVAGVVCLFCTKRLRQAELLVHVGSAHLSIAPPEDEDTQVEELIASTLYLSSLAKMIVRHCVAFAASRDINRILAEINSGDATKSSSSPNSGRGGSVLKIGGNAFQNTVDASNASQEFAAGPSSADSPRDSIIPAISEIDTDDAIAVNREGERDSDLDFAQSHLLPVSVPEYFRRSEELVTVKREPVDDQEGIAAENLMMDPCLGGPEFVVGRSDIWSSSAMTDGVHLGDGAVVRTGCLERITVSSRRKPTNLGAPVLPTICFNGAKLAPGACQLCFMEVKGYKKDRSHHVWVYHMDGNRLLTCTVCGYESQYEVDLAQNCLEEHPDTPSIIQDNTVRLLPKFEAAYESCFLKPPSGSSKKTRSANTTSVVDVEELPIAARLQTAKPNRKASANKRSQRNDAGRLNDECQAESSETHSLWQLTDDALPFSCAVCGYASRSEEDLRVYCAAEHPNTQSVIRRNTGADGSASGDSPERSTVGRSRRSKVKRKSFDVGLSELPYGRVGRPSLAKRGIKLRRSNDALGKVLQYEEAPATSGNCNSNNYLNQLLKATLAEGSQTEASSSIVKVPLQPSSSAKAERAGKLCLCCTMCREFVQTNYDALHKHVLLKHFRRRIFVCSKCGYITEHGRHIMTRHVDRNHPTEKVSIDERVQEGDVFTLKERCFPNYLQRIDEENIGQIHSSSENGLNLE